MIQQRSYDVFSQIPNKESKYELNLRNLNLTQLPIDLSSFVSLYKLDISNNPFTDVIHFLIVHIVQKSCCFLGIVTKFEAAAN